MDKGFTPQNFDEDGDEIIEERDPLGDALEIYQTIRNPSTIRLMLFLEKEDLAYKYGDAAEEAYIELDELLKALDQLVEGGLEEKEIADSKQFKHLRPIFGKVQKSYQGFDMKAIMLISLVETWLELIRKES